MHQATANCNDQRIENSEKIMKTFHCSSILLVRSAVIQFYNATFLAVSSVDMMIPVWSAASLVH